VDAALDNVNVQKVASFIQRRANPAISQQRGLSPLQFLVISLKDSFFSQAELLVGIYRDSSAVCSRRMCLDLTSYAASKAGSSGRGGAGSSASSSSSSSGVQSKQAPARAAGGEEEEEEE
jgi:hypothetical protein